MANPTPTAERPAEKADATSPAKPVATFRYGSVSAALFAENVKLPSGITLPLYQASLRRSYRDRSGEWKHTHSLRMRDLLPSAYALVKCFEYLASYQDGLADADSAEERE